MPDESARNALWHEIGACVPMNASQYFRTIINYAEKLKIPEELTSQETGQMQAAALRSKMLRLNPGLPAQGVQFSCQPSYAGSILTDIKICYRSKEAMASTSSAQVMCSAAARLPSSLKALSEPLQRFYLYFLSYFC